MAHGVLFLLDTTKVTQALLTSLVNQPSLKQKKVLKGKGVPSQPTILRPHEGHGAQTQQPHSATSTASMMQVSTGTAYLPHGAGMQPHGAGMQQHGAGMQQHVANNGASLPHHLTQAPPGAGYQSAARYPTVSAHHPMATATSAHGGHGYVPVPSPHGGYNAVPASMHLGDHAHVHQPTMEAIPAPTSLLTSSAPSEPR